jgi:multidrug efflux system membrane fusion protein
MTKVFSMAVVAASVLVAAACEQVHGKADAPARPVKVQGVEALAQESRARYSATIEADERVSLAFKSSGYVDAVLHRRGADGQVHPLQPGDTVRAGDVLARVRDSDYRERVNQTTSSAREADAGRAKAQLDLERARALFAAESLTKPDLDAALAAFDSADARHAGARAQLALAELGLRDCALVSPIDGVVLERRVEVGTLAGPGVVGFVVGRVTPVKAVFGVPDLLVDRMKLGAEIEVATEAFAGTTFRGRVTAIAPSADMQSRVFNVEVSVPNADGRLRPGMIGRVEVAAGPVAAAAPQAGTVAVPLVAIVRSDKGDAAYAVFVVEGSPERPIVKVRPVTLGDVRGNVVAVTKGLTLGERVVVSGPGLLTDGEPVRLIR